MASIPTNGYAEVMAGANNYSGSNSFDGSCPQTAIPPVVGNDLCNKTYVDGAGGGIVGSLTDKGSLLTGDGTQAVIFDQNPYQTALTTTTVYDWNSLALGQSRDFTTTAPTSIPLGASITITYSGTDSITGTITAIAGTTITLTITALASATYTPAVLLTTTAPDTTTFAGAIFTGQTMRFNPAVSTPPTAQIPPFSMITSGECNVFQNAGGGGNFLFRLLGTGVQRGDSSTQALGTAIIGTPNPTALTWSGTNGGCFYNSATAQIPLPLLDLIAPSPPLAADFQYPLGGGFVIPDYAGFLSGYALSYGTGAITIAGDIVLLADPVSATGLSWGVVSGGGGGGGTVNSVVGGTNIVMSGSLSAPVVNLRNPLTAELNVGTQNITGTTGALTFSGGGTGSLTEVQAGGIAVQDDTVLTIISTMSKFGFTTQNSSGASLTIAPTGLSSIATPISITPDAGEDVNVSVTGAGSLNVISNTIGGVANPLLVLQNNNNTQGGTTFETYKNDLPTSTGGDPVGIWKASCNTNIGKTEITRISAVANGVGAGNNDGSLVLACKVNSGLAPVNFINCNGGAGTGSPPLGEVQLFKPLNMTGQNIITTSGDMTISTTNSSGTGNFSLTSKLNQIYSGTALSSSFTTQAVYNCPLEIHTGKLQTPSSDQVYQPKYQPFITSTPLTFPVGDIARDGQECMLINSLGDGGNELTRLATPSFTLTCFEYIPSIASYVGGGFNHIQGRPEIRCAASLNAIIQSIGVGTFTYVAFSAATNPTGAISCMCYDPVLFPTTIAFGGNFTATTADNYKPSPPTPFPSPVSNFICIDITSTNIAPIDMLDPALLNAPFQDLYGVDNDVLTIAAYNGSNIGASGNAFILGGLFTNINSNGFSSVGVGHTALFIPVGGIFPPANLKWFSLIEANAFVTSITTNPANSNVLIGGEYTTLDVNGGATGTTPYLSWCDNLLSGGFLPVGSGASPFIAPSAVSAGSKTIIGSSGFNYTNSAFFACKATGSPTTYPVYEVDMDDLSLYEPILYKDDFPAEITAFGANYHSPSTPRNLGFIVGGNLSGGAWSNVFIWDVATPHFLDLNGAGAQGLQNVSYQNTISPPPPYFSVYPFSSYLPPFEISFYEELGEGAVVINTTPALPFVNFSTPLNKFDTITLAARNNFAMGTVVGFGTDDARILIYAHNGATFTNPP
jgi:hypothetical protein